MNQEIKDDSTSQVEMVSELPELPEPNFAQSLFIGGRCVAESYTADQMRAYAQAALNARAGGEAVAELIHSADALTRMVVLPEGMQLGYGTHKLYTSPTRASEAGDCPDGFVLVRKEAIDWLNGESDFECPPDRYFRGQPPRYWWRSVFREKAGLAIAAAPAPGDG